jgi:hypothetical protein
MVAYGLVKKIERIDESNTLRFCFVYWLGEHVPRMQRARISTHRGAILDFFAVSFSTPFKEKQYHTTIMIDVDI